MEVGMSGFNPRTGKGLTGVLLVREGDQGSLVYRHVAERRNAVADPL